jgi:hypothetical protein
MNAEKLKSYGEFFETLKPGNPVGICRQCGRILTDLKSIEAGIGPECAEKEKAGA